MTRKDQKIGLTKAAVTTRTLRYAHYVYLVLRLFYNGECEMEKFFAEIGHPCRRLTWIDKVRALESIGVIEWDRKRGVIRLRKKLREGPLLNFPEFLKALENPASED